MCACVVRYTPGAQTPARTLPHTLTIAMRTSKLGILFGFRNLFWIIVKGSFRRQKERRERETTERTVRTGRLWPERDYLHKTVKNNVMKLRCLFFFEFVSLMNCEYLDITVASSLGPQWRPVAVVNGLRSSARSNWIDPIDSPTIGSSCDMEVSLSRKR